MGATLEGIPGVSDTTKAFVQAVRLYLRDFAELNRLIAGEETNDRMIAWSVFDALSNFNGTPPITQVSLDQLLERQQHHLMMRMTVEAIIEYQRRCERQDPFADELAAVLQGVHRTTEAAGEGRPERREHPRLRAGRHPL
jgi:hypothetical protein